MLAQPLPFSVFQWGERLGEDRGHQADPALPGSRQPETQHCPAGRAGTSLSPRVPIPFSHLPALSSRFWCSLLVLMLPPGPWQIEVPRGHRGWDGSGGRGIVVASRPRHPSCRGNAGGTAGNQCMPMDGVLVLSHILIEPGRGARLKFGHPRSRGWQGGCQGDSGDVLALGMSCGVSGAQADPPSSPHHRDRSWRRPPCWNPSATPKP